VIDVRDDGEIADKTRIHELFVILTGSIFALGCALK
jgi:hypothetical protein